MAESSVAASRGTLAEVARGVLTLVEDRQFARSPLLIERLGQLIRASDDQIARTALGPMDDPEQKELLTIARALRRALYLLMADANPDQAWFWTEEWQAGERAVDARLAVRTGERPYTEDEFDAALRAVRA